MFIWQILFGNCWNNSRHQEFWYFEVISGEYLEGTRNFHLGPTLLYLNVKSILFWNENIIFFNVCYRHLIMNSTLKSKKFTWRSYPLIIPLSYSEWIFLTTLILICSHRKTLFFIKNNLRTNVILLVVI